VAPTYLDTDHVHESFRNDVLLHSWKETGMLVPWSTPELEWLRDSSTVPGPSGEYHDYGEVGDVFGQPTPRAMEESRFSGHMDPVHWYDPSPLVYYGEKPGQPQFQDQQGATTAHGAGVEVASGFGPSGWSRVLSTPEADLGGYEVVPGGQAPAGARWQSNSGRIEPTPAGCEVVTSQFALDSHCGRGVGYRDYEVQVLWWSYRWRVYYPSLQDMEPGDSSSPSRKSCHRHRQS